MSRAPPLILLGGEDEEDGAQGVCVTPPLSNEMNSVTHSQLCTLHGVDSKDRSRRDLALRIHFIYTSLQSCQRSHHMLTLNLMA